MRPGDARFPDPESADANGIVAVGGDLRPKTLLTAYAMGIFPWYHEGIPILWHSPNPRFVLEPSKLHVPKSLRKQMKRGVYEIRFDTSFDEVIDACAEPREGQDGTWITSDMREAYRTLFALGFVHTAESWLDGKLVGGLYGVSLGSVFFGESMFARAPDASKVAFATLVEQLVAWKFTLIDCQQETAHLERFGAEAWPRRRFLEALAQGLQHETRRGPWKLETPSNPETA